MTCFIIYDKGMQQKCNIDLRAPLRLRQPQVPRSMRCTAAVSYKQEATVHIGSAKTRQIGLCYIAISIVTFGR